MGNSSEIDQPLSPYRAYFHSSATINHIRALLSSGYADLHRPSAWSFAHVRSPDLQAKFEDIVERLKDSLDFMKTIGASNQSYKHGNSQGVLDTVEIWTSHEVSASRLIIPIPYIIMAIFGL